MTHIVAAADQLCVFACDLSVQDKISEDDKKTILEAVKEALEWVEENSDAEADEFKDKLKEVRDQLRVLWTGLA